MLGATEARPNGSLKIRNWNTDRGLALTTFGHCDFVSSILRMGRWSLESELLRWGRVRRSRRGKWKKRRIRGEQGRAGEKRGPCVTQSTKDE
jgi:hypothetical protein